MTLGAVEITPRLRTRVSHDTTLLFRNVSTFQNSFSNRCFNLIYIRCFSFIIFSISVKHLQQFFFRSSLSCVRDKQPSYLFSNRSPLLLRVSHQPRSPVSSSVNRSFQSGINRCFSLSFVTFNFASISSRISGKMVFFERS